MEIRIKKLINDKKMNSAQFASEIGIAASSLHHIVSGRNNPSLEVIQKILSRFPEINAEWLINGQNQPYRSDFIQEENQNELFEITSETTNNEEDKLKANLKSNKKIEKIIFFYEDNTFDIYYS